MHAGVLAHACVGTGAYRYTLTSHTSVADGPNRENTRRRSSVTDAAAAQVVQDPVHECPLPILQVPHPSFSFSLELPNFPCPDALCVLTHYRQSSICKTAAMCPGLKATCVMLLSPQPQQHNKVNHRVAV